MNAATPPLPSLPVVRLGHSGSMLQLTDERGGEALVLLARPEAHLIQWQAVPAALRHTPAAAGYKRRGFTRTVLGALAQLGVEQLTVRLQSEDSRRALARLVDEQALTPVPGFTLGSSNNEYPTRFHLHAERCRAVQLIADGAPGLDAALLQGAAALPCPREAPVRIIPPPPDGPE